MVTGIVKKSPSEAKKGGNANKGNNRRVSEVEKTVGGNTRACEHLLKAFTELQLGICPIGHHCGLLSSLHNMPQYWRMDN